MNVGGGSTRSALVVVFLLDGKQHKWSEFRDYLYRQLDPRIAVRNYLGHRNDPKAPLEAQIAKGGRVAFRQTISQLVDTGAVVVEECGLPGGDDFLLQLTDKGKLAVRTGEKRGAICGKVMAALARMYLKGDLELEVSLSDKGNGI